jgi:hypothetical protein
MTNELKDLLNKANYEVNNHPKGQLILPLRKEIYRLMGEHSEDNEGRVLRTDGFLRRLNLAILCVNYVLPVWNSVMPDNNTPDTLLKSINEYLSGHKDWDSLWELQNDFWAVLDNYMCDDNDYGASIYVGHSSINAVMVALNDEDLGEEDYINIYDEDLDPYTWDTAFYASLAYSENKQYDEGTKIQKRRDFWLWYLNNAVPLAYQSTKT